MTSVIFLLQSLLIQLKGGKVLDLSVLAAFQEARNTSNSLLFSNSITNPHDDNQNSIININKLFTEHVGQSPKIILEF